MTTLTTTPPAVTPTRYSSPSRFLHWLTVLLVLTTIPAGLIMVQEGLPRGLQDGLFIYHKNIGPVILLVVILRLILRAVYPAPPLPASIPPAQAMIAHATHWALYLFLILMAVSGFLRVQAGGFPMELWDRILPEFVPVSKTLELRAQAVHSFVRYLLILTILAHVGAAAMHGLIKRDGVFSRMWPPA